MALIEQPAILPGEFAQEGDKNTIPENNDGLSGLASIMKGFPPITQQPLSSGGLPPQRADFNGIFNLFSKFLMYIQSGGIFEYNNTLDYQPPAIVWGNNNFYKCKQANGASTSAGVQPLTNTNYWELVTPIKNITGSNNILTVTNGNNTSDTITINALQNAPGTNDNSNKIPTTAWVQTWVKNFINSLDDNLSVQWSGSTFTVPALGITGLMAQNGYISLGKLFGGLILQWGRLTLQNNPVNISLPISLIDLFVAFATSNDAGQTNVYRVNPSIANAKDLKIVSVNLPPEPKQGMYVVVGR